MRYIGAVSERDCHIHYLAFIYIIFLSYYFTYFKVKKPFQFTDILKFLSTHLDIKSKIIMFIHFNVYPLLSNYVG